MCASLLLRFVVVFSTMHTHKRKKDYIYTYAAVPSTGSLMTNSKAQSSRDK